MHPRREICSPPETQFGTRLKGTFLIPRAPLLIEVCPFTLEEVGDIFVASL